MKEKTKEEEAISIIHIDDDEYFLELTRVKLEEIDPRITVTSYDDPLKARDILNRDHEKYDVVICDYDMKNLDGLKILADLQGKNIDIAFIILTGKEREEIVIKALNLGVDYYVQKNVDSSVLYAEIRHYILACVNKKKEELKRRIAEIRYKNLFEESPVQCWLEDFSAIISLIDEIKSKNIDNIREYIENHPEIVRESIQKIKIIDANKASLEAIGASSKSAILGGLNRIIGKGAFNIVKEEIILAEGKKNFKIESLVDTTERGRIIFDLWFSVVPGYKRDLFLVWSVDITELANERNTLQKQMQETELFLSIITHDLKNYHHTSKGFNDLIIKLDLNSSKISQYAKKSNEGISRASNLLNNISIIMRDKLDKKYDLYPISISESITSVKMKINELFTLKDIQYTEDIDQNIHILADSLFKYLLLNILSNAVKNDDSDVIKIEITAKKDSGNRLLAISDHGQGIPPEMIEKIFDKYTEFRQKGQGSGLGMYIIKTLVDRYGGNIRIHNRVKADKNKGTTIVITLKHYDSESH